MVFNSKFSKENLGRKNQTLIMLKNRDKVLGEFETNDPLSKKCL